MIQVVNWNWFKAKFNGHEQSSFELFCYLLFCKEFNHNTGIPRFKNHAGIETDPVKVDGKIIGWQAKFCTTRLSELKGDLINSIKITKTRNPEINIIIFYTNQEFGQHNKKTDPKYKIDIEDYANTKGVEIVWRTESYFESPFVCEQNYEIAKHFFSSEKKIVNVFVSGPLVNEKLVDFLTANNHYTKNFIQAFLDQNANDINLIQSIDQNFLLLEVLKSSSINLSVDKIQEEYGKIVLGKNMALNNDKVKYKILDAGTCVKNLEFDTAHQLLDEALNKIKPDSELYSFVYKEYLITGFICYSRNNDVNGLKSLLREKSEIGNDGDLDTDYIISIIFQEIFSRDTDLNSLREVVSTLEKIYTNVGDVIKPSMANSLGLAYRRLGERTNISYLKDAIRIFKEGLEVKTCNKSTAIELKDQMAIAHIRIFEFNKDEAELNYAVKLLNECLSSLEEPMDPKDYRLKPRILNNLGNIYKQRTLVFNDIKSASKAITIYEEAEQYWNKKDAKYDWALLRKNIAETKYALGKLTNDNKILFEALNDCIKSTQYRNLKNSPYQWGKTIKIVFSIILLLGKRNSLKSISESKRKKILSYIKVVSEDESKWSENISPEFVQNARQVQTIFLLNNWN